MNNEKTTAMILKFCDLLPDWCNSFVLATGTEYKPLTRLAYIREINNFMDYLITFVPHFSVLEKKDISPSDFEQITSEDISRYFTFYFDKGRDKKTVARKRAVLSSFFQYQIANKRLAFNPVIAAAKVKLEKTDEIFHLEVDEQLTLLNEVDCGSHLSKRAEASHHIYRKRDLAILTLMLDTGLRISELQGIDIKDLDFNDCCVFVTRKGNKTQHVYFSDHASEILKDYLAERKEYKDKDPLFITHSGERIGIRAIQKMVKKYAVASLPGKGQKVTPHKMRSSFAFTFYDASNNDILALQRKMGHSSINATNRYVAATDKTMQETRNLVEQAKK